MILPDSKERRKNPRVQVNWSVEFETPEGKLKGELENISVGGAYVRCAVPLLEDDFFTVTIFSSRAKPIQCGARVVWIDRYLSEYNRIPIGMGVRFLQLSDEDREFMTAVILERLESTEN